MFTVELFDFWPEIVCVMQYFNPVKADLLQSCKLLFLCCAEKLLKDSLWMESLMKKRLLCRRRAVECISSALESHRAKKRDEERRRWGKIHEKRFMMFVPQSSCISYNYVDIVIYQKINWSFAWEYSQQERSNCLWPFFFKLRGTENMLKTKFNEFSFWRWRKVKTIDGIEVRKRWCFDLWIVGSCRQQRVKFSRTRGLLDRRWGWDSSICFW
jgi:hypothetical protein